MQVRITCVNKDNGNHTNPHEAITQYGWLNETSLASGKSSKAEMVKWLEAGNKAYVKEGLLTAFCVVRTSIAGNKFLQTVRDGHEQDNLLNLLECN